MAKIFLFDVDGVLIRPRTYFSTVLSEQGYLTAPEKLDEYYRNDVLCMIGKEDALETITPYLKSFGWPFDSREYFHRLFEHEARYLDKELIDLIKELRKDGCRCYLATDQNHLRKSMILEGLALKSVFDGWFVSADLGYRKIERPFWEHTLKAFSKNIHKEILFIDDRIPNLEQARAHGIAGFHVSGETRIKELKRLLRKKLRNNEN